MNYPVTTTIQLRAVLRALRRSRSLTQSQVGQLLGVNQKRIAAIENAPGVTGFAQVARLVATLGGRLVVEAPDSQPLATTKASKQGQKVPPRSKTPPPGNW